jgi:hypothetical protein
MLLFLNAPIVSADYKIVIEEASGRQMKIFIEDGKIVGTNKNY